MKKVSSHECRWNGAEADENAVKIEQQHLQN